MRTYVLTHLSDAVLLRDLTVLVAQERTATAAVLAHIAEVDARRLFLPAGYTSMHAYCVGELRLSEDAAFKRIQAARTARDFPALFTALADGRLHLTGLGLLIPHLTAGNADQLLAEAAHRTKAEIEEMLARRFPGNERMELVEFRPASRPAPLASAKEEALCAHDLAKFGELAPAQVAGLLARSKVKPLATDRYTFHLTIDQEGYDLLRYAQALMSHQVSSGDIARVFFLSLREKVIQLEKRMFGKTTKPRSGSRRMSLSPRHIPAHVKLAVWERDRGECTFVGDGGRRCGARTCLQFDHVDPVARGGQATVENLRLRCRGHNQLEAERVFGAGFMHEKREEARRAATERRTPRAREAEGSARRIAEAEARAQTGEAEARAREAALQRSRDLTTCLRELRFGAAEARRAVGFCATLPDTTLEEQVRAALAFLCPKPRSLSSSETRAIPPRGFEGAPAP